MPSLILFLFCLFLHGSHARYLDLHGSSYDRLQCYFLNSRVILVQAAKKIGPSAISSKSPLKLTHRSLWSSFKTEKQVENSENNGIDANPNKQKASNSSQKDSSPSGMNEEVVVSDEIYLHGKEYKTKVGFMKIRGETKKPRVEGEDEAVDSTENGGEEDVVMMDYAQPHRKPPIHNEKP